MNSTAVFEPDWTSPPGDTVMDLLEERNISTEAFAQSIGYSLSQARSLLYGHEPITHYTAQQLANVLGATPEFWLAREHEYQADSARLRLKDADGENWLTELPIKDMRLCRWIAPNTGAKDLLAVCLKFFEVDSVNTWRRRYQDLLQTSAFRKSPSFASSLGATAVWLRRGEMEADLIECKAWDPNKFAQALQTIRALTKIKDPASFLPELKSMCAECGVAIAVVRAPSGCRVSGATRFLSQKKALLLLSFRYLSDDHFWFTFFHEAGHLLLHGQKLILEGDSTASNREEEEANHFSARSLIPSKFEDALRTLGSDSRAIIKFAVRIGVSPGIVVGQLQHRGLLRHNQLNSLKRRYKWSDE